MACTTCDASLHMSHRQSQRRHPSSFPQTLQRSRGGLRTPPARRHDARPGRLEEHDNSSTSLFFCLSFPIKSGRRSPLTAGIVIGRVVGEVGVLLLLPSRRVHGLLCRRHAWCGYPLA